MQNPGPVVGRFVGRALRALPVAGVLLAAGDGAHAACVRSTVLFYDGFESGDTLAWSTANLTGFARDYWTGIPLASATIGTTAPPRNDVSDALGRYRLVDLAPALAVEALATRAGGYRATGNGPIVIDGLSRSCDLFLMASADVNRQYTTVGMTPTAGLAILVAEIRRPDDSPLEGIPLVDVQLTDAGSAPIGIGPYFFGATGDVDPGLFVSTAFSGSARVAFLDVPITAATLTVNSAEPGVGGSVSYAPVASGANTFVLGGVD